MKLFELVTIRRKNDSKPARHFSDYEVAVGKALQGVELIEMV